MPSSKGLFMNAVMESNPLGLPYHTRAQAAENAKAVFEYCGCAADDVSCMRQASVDCILDAQDSAVPLDLDTLLLNFLPFGPIVDDGADALLPAQPLYALAAGQQTTFMPMLQGSLYDEGQLFVYELFTQPLSEGLYKALVAVIFGAANAPRILSLYPFGLSAARANAPQKDAASARPLHVKKRWVKLQEQVASLVPQLEAEAVAEAADDAAEADGRWALNVLATDLLFYCPLRNITRGYQQAGAACVFSVRFSHTRRVYNWFRRLTVYLFVYSLSMICTRSCCEWR